MKPTPGPWSLWMGERYVGGGEDICIGAGRKWLANMDHRVPRCPQIHEDGHDADACDICSIDSGDISEEQLANARLIAAACNSYQKAFPDDPLGAAESDELAKAQSLNAELLEALNDCASGMAYVLHRYGRLEGVGFDRALAKAEAVIAKAEGRL